MQLNMRDWRLPALVGVAFVFALLSGGRLPYFLFYVTGGVLVVAYGWAQHAMRRTDLLIQANEDRVEVGQSVSVRLRLDNDSIFPLPWAEVDDCTPAHLVWTDMPRQATSVPLWGSRLIHLRLTARRRGHYRIGPIRVRLGDPFGLFEASREYQSRATITVYPRLHHIEGVPIPLSQPFGPVRTRERAFEDPSNQSEIRKYRPGDNPRHIHWKTSARVGTLMLREYELSATTQMVLFPDLQHDTQVIDPLTGVSVTAETSLEIAASLAALGLRRKIATGLICHAQERFALTAGGGERSFHQIMEVLSRVEAQGQVPIEQLLEMEAPHLSGKSTLVIITPHLTPRLADTLIRLRANHQVMLVLLRAETFLAAAAKPVISPLAGLLSLRRIPVYMVGAQDDLRQFGDLRLTIGAEGVKAWSPAARLSGIRP